MAKDKNDNEERLKQEITALRTEVRQLREVVNLLLEMVMERGDDEEYEIEFGGFRLDRNNKLQMGM